MLIIEYPIVTVKCRTAIKALHHYFTLCRNDNVSFQFLHYFSIMFK